MKLVFSAILAAQLLNGISAAKAAYTYFEDGGLGPSNWANLPIEGNECGGMEGKTGYGQSPVTIDEATVSRCDTGMSQYNFTGGNCLWTDLEFTINAGGLVVTPTNDCSFGHMEIPHSPSTFNALQFHIHTFSEHRIMGQYPFEFSRQGDAGSFASNNGYFPAELHVVHAEETGESFAVFGTMIAVGSEEHPMFEWFLQGWEAAAQKVEDECLAATTALFESTSVVESMVCPAIGARSIFNGTSPDFPAGGPNLYELPTNPDFGTFTYKGGLTTPGCTEIVNWNLLDTPMTISADQLLRLESLVLCYVGKTEAEDGSIESCGHRTIASETGSTSRPPQPLLGRTVLHRCRNGPNVIIDDHGVTEEDAANSPEEEASAPSDEESESSAFGAGNSYLVFALLFARLLFG